MKKIGKKTFIDNNRRQYITLLLFATFLSWFPLRALFVIFFLFPFFYHVKSRQNKSQIKLKIKERKALQHLPFCEHKGQWQSAKLKLENFIKLFSASRRQLSKVLKRGKGSHSIFMGDCASNGRAFRTPLSDSTQDESVNIFYLWTSTMKERMRKSERKKKMSLCLTLWHASDYDFQQLQIFPRISFKLWKRCKFRWKFSIQKVHGKVQQVSLESFPLNADSFEAFFNPEAFDLKTTRAKLFSEQNI